MGLVDDSNKLCGYAIPHPIRRQQPPKLDTMLGQISEEADQYYIHDLAVLPGFRGHGYAQACIKNLFIVSKYYETTCLISVYGTEPFWKCFGFAPVQIGEDLKKALVEYGEDAAYLERKNNLDE